MRVRQNLAGVLRAAGLMKPADRLRYAWMRLRNRSGNRAFRLAHPGVVLPPDYLMYESFMLDYSRYYLNGRKTAEWLAGLAGRHRDLGGSRILDWGCGPARVIRHLPEIIPGAELYGTDYNRKTIEWCAGAFTDIHFHANDLMPRMIYEDGLFDLVYGISIFTHLSAEGHDAWLKELVRVLKPGGILFLTLHGESFCAKLTPSEMEIFREGRLVVRGHVTEGHRTYAAFHPAAWVRQWAGELTVLEHLAGGPGEQDVWIFRR